MTNPRTTTSYALLGLLSIRSWTTYELTQQAHKSLRWFWPRAERKLYDEPKRLVEDGLATATSESTGRRPRTVYRVTPRGRRALRSWLDEAPEPRSEEFAAMVKVFFAEAGSRDQLLTTIDRVEEEAAARLRELARMASTRPLVFPARGHLNALVMRMHADQEEAVLRWARWARAQVERWPSTTDTGDWDHDAALREIAELADRDPHTA